MRRCSRGRSHSVLYSDGSACRAGSCAVKPAPHELCNKALAPGQSLRILLLPQAEGDAAAAEAWWPPVAAALRALGQLYGALDSRTFGGLAQDAVAAATTSVQSASRAVAKRERNDEF